MGLRDIQNPSAGVAELVDAQDSNSCFHYESVGSIPTTRTILLVMR